MTVVQDPASDGLGQQEDAQVTRRSWMTAAATAVGAVAVAAVAPSAVDAATPTVKLGATNTINKGTTIKDTASSSSAKAFVGRTTYTGTALSSAGVEGISDGNNGNGVIGQANHGTSAAGVWGRTTTGFGVYGSGPMGVVGSGGGVGSVGLFGIGDDDGTAMSAIGGTTVGSTGLHASVQGAGWAAYLDGDVYIAGTVFGPPPVVVLDHPDAPGERWYRQAAIASFEQLSVISGNTRTGADGTVVVEVPDLFARMHRDFRYQLTVIGSPASANIARGLRKGRFTVRTDKPRVKVSWQVTGVRDDPSARAHPFHVSVEKRGAARGRFMEPALFGKSASRAIGARLARSVHRTATLLHDKRRVAAADD